MAQTPGLFPGEWDREADEFRDAVPIFSVSFGMILPPLGRCLSLWWRELQTQVTVFMPGQATPTCCLFSCIFFAHGNFPAFTKLCGKFPCKVHFALKS